MDHRAKETTTFEFSDGGELVQEGRSTPHKEGGQQMLPKCVRWKIPTNFVYENPQIQYYDKNNLVKMGKKFGKLDSPEEPFRTKLALYPYLEESIENRDLIIDLFFSVCVFNQREGFSCWINPRISNKWSQ